MIIKSDGVRDWQYGFQDMASPIGEGILKFHHNIMIVIVFVVVLVGWALARIVYLGLNNNNKIVPKGGGIVHGTMIEIIWTILPAIILMIVAVPSFALLYSIDEVVEPTVTVKVIGHQWYWSYEYDNEKEFDSYMLPEEELEIGDYRLLEVDNRMVLPVETHIRLIITAADVLHSFAVPGFGIKMDCCPGRLNEVSLYIKRPGVFYGQCSEICGVNHAFMPIAVEVVSKEEYVEWLEA